MNPNFPPAAASSITHVPSPDQPMLIDQTIQERDQLHRSVDKPIPTDPHPSAVAWKTSSGVAIVTGKVPSDQIYTGEGEDGDDDTQFPDTELMGPERDDDQLIIPLSECRNLWRPWRKALIIKLVGKTITYNYLCKRLLELWKHTGRIEITDLERGFFVVRFTNKADYQKALEGGPWTILGHYLAVRKWKPFFQPETEEITTTLAWVRFSGLSLEIFQENLLMKLGNMVGKAIRVDPTTIQNIRGRYARVCVELNLKQSLRPSVVVNGRRYKIEYEGLPNICYGCGMFGHNKDMCPSQSKPEENQQGTLSHQKAPEQPKGPTLEQPWGPWSIAERRRRWTHPRQNQQKNTDTRQQVINAGHIESSTMPNAVVGSRFGELMDEEAVTKVVNDEVETEVEKVDSTIQELEELRQSAKAIQSHGGPVKVREVQKPANTNQKNASSASKSKISQSQKPGGKHDERAQHHARENNKRKDYTVDLSAQSHQMKKSGSNKSKSGGISKSKAVERQVLEDLTNGVLERQDTIPPSEVHTPIQKEVHSETLHPDRDALSQLSKDCELQLNNPLFLANDGDANSIITPQPS